MNQITRGLEPLHKKTLSKSERDCGFPIDYQQKLADTGVVSIPGVPIDSICDLTDHAGGTNADLQSANACLLLSELA